MSTRKPLRDIGKKALNLRTNPGARVSSDDRLAILGAGLLADAQPLAQGLRQHCQGGGHYRSENMSPLAAAEDQQFNRLVGSGCGIGNGAEGEDRRPDWISGMDGAGPVASPQPVSVGKSRGNTPDERRQQPV